MSLLVRGVRRFGSAAPRHARFSSCDAEPRRLMAGLEAALRTARFSEVCSSGGRRRSRHRSSQYYQASAAAVRAALDALEDAATQTTTAAYHDGDECLALLMKRMCVSTPA